MTPKELVNTTVRDLGAAALERHPELRDAARIEPLYDNLRMFLLDNGWDMETLTVVYIALLCQGVSVPQ